MYHLWHSHPYQKRTHQGIALLAVAAAVALGAVFLAAQVSVPETAHAIGSEKTYGDLGTPTLLSATLRFIPGLIWLRILMALTSVIAYLNMTSYVLGAPERRRKRRATQAVRNFTRHRHSHSMLD
jgi:hypothetical protein